MVIDKEFIQTMFSTLIPAIVTILGFVVTYFAMRRSFREEIKKQKSNITLEKMTAVPYGVMQLYEHLMEPVKVEKMIESLELTDKEARELRTKVSKNSQDVVLEMKELFNTIFCYGSEKANLILSTMQRHNYANTNISSVNIEEKHRVLAYYILLATQIRYDVTGVVVNPLFWYKTNITDFDEHEDFYKKLNNVIVDELSLDKKMLA